MLHRYVRDIPVAIHPETVAQVPVWRIDVQDITARVHHPTADWQAALGIKAPIASGIHYDASGAVTATDAVDDQTAAVDSVAGASHHASSARNR
ncbi:hypothetical protein [Lactiplantibacillus carotarum]|uniref:hypothetical protein n=1 Tax=Lactiplantibacillus carotarum TaxID=2993456 RepID=UPI00298F06BC|nr:hypothetical protein [Lactiplantibacillus carotarum]